MNRTSNKNLNVNTFRIWDYPIFALLFGYVWLEAMNPVIGYSLQIIPTIPNSAIALLLCYMTRPNFIKQIKVPFNPVKWTLPFLIIATINLPFVQYAQYRSIVDLISTWFWVLFLLPLMIRVIATPSGRGHFVLFSTISLTLLAWQYYFALFSYQFIVGKIIISHHTLSVGVIALLPILIGYIYLKKGLTRYFLIICLTVILIAAIPSGARSMWLIVPFELILIGLFVLPKSRLMINGVVTAALFSIFLSFWNLSDIYSSVALQHFETRMRKAREWQQDSTVWKRFGMVTKTKMILEEHPFLGVGYSNRSFTGFDGGDVEFMGHLAKIRRIDAHNTYLNILGGTGILGFFAFLYFFWKVFALLMQMNSSVYRRLETGPFIISVVGTLTWYMFNTHPFSHFVQTAALIIGLYVYAYNIELMDQTEIDQKAIS